MQAVEPADRVERKRRGAWYTPPAVVELLVAQAVAPAVAAVRAGHRPGPVRILDPACGDGRVLRAALVCAGHAEPAGALASDDWSLGSRSSDAATVDPSAAVRAPGSGMLVSGDWSLGSRSSDTSGMRPADPAGRMAAAVAVAVDVVGIEVDPASAAMARSSVPSARILVGDGREVDPGGRFEAVVGNPPFLNQLARATTRGGRSRLGGGPYADAAAEFLLRALDLAHPDGGRVALVLPHSVLGTRDTAAVRAAVRDQAAVAGVWWAGAKVFDAAVHVCVLVLERGGRQGPVRRWHGRAMTPLPAAGPDAVAGPTWGPLVADAAGIPSVRLGSGGGRLGDIATATAGFRQHFYGLAPFVDDDRTGPPLVTTGLVDVGHCAWGRRPVRFAKRRFAAPRVDIEGLESADPALAGWVRGQMVPKVLVAPQTRVIEAVVDAEGAWVPSVPLVSVRPRRPDDLWLVAAVLLAPPVAAWAAARHLGTGLGPTSLRLSATDVLDLPLPAQPWTDAAALLEAGDVDASAEAMCRAYGLDGAAAEDLLHWWRRGRAAGVVAPAAGRGRDSSPWSPSSTP